MEGFFQSKSNIILLIIVILAFVLLIIYVVFQTIPKNGQGKNLESFHLYEGRNPFGAPECCGNIDWYLGPKEYKQYCPKSAPPAFENTEQYYAYLQEGFTGANSYGGQKEFLKQASDCAASGLKPAYNPHICQKNNTDIVVDANCKCTDEFGNCKKCFDKIEMAYQ